jgi:SET domain-containing protein
MMMVETELRPSAIHGVGVFLLEPVRQGGLIWRFDSRVDRIYAPAEIASLPAHVQRYLKTYCTWHEGAGLYVLCGDNGRYFNHASAPSTISNAVSFGEDHAARDLRIGEELTSDYATICDEVRRNGAEFARPQTRTTPALGESRSFGLGGPALGPP